MKEVLVLNMRVGEAVAKSNRKLFPVQHPHGLLALVVLVWLKLV